MNETDGRFRRTIPPGFLEADHDPVCVTHLERAERLCASREARGRWESLPLRRGFEDPERESDDCSATLVSRSVLPFSMTDLGTHFTWFPAKRSEMVDRRSSRSGSGQRAFNHWGIPS